MNPFNFFMVDKSIYVTREDHFLSILWVFFMLFPTGTVFNVMVPVLLLLTYNRRQRYNTIMLPLLVLMIPALVFNLNYEYMNFKVYARYVEIGVCFYTFASLRGNKILFPYIWGTFFFILLSQISAMFIPSIYAYYDRIYNITESMLEMYQTDMSAVDMQSMAQGTRLGGIYHNPNVCASYITVLYSLGLSEIRQLGNSKTLIYFFMGLVLFSFFLTGSRTSLLCFLAITGYYMYSQGYSIIRYLCIGVVGLTIFFVSKFDANSVRMLDVESGMTNSFGAKMSLFWHYLTHCTNPIQLVFGGGDIAASGLYNTSFDGGTDCDFGNIFIMFGAIFWLLYWKIYYRFYKVFKKEYRVLLFTLLWVFSNSLLISYRMCPVWFVCLGLLYRRSLTENQTDIRTGNGG